jgi:hypothetical protein
VANYEQASEILADTAIACGIPPSANPFGSSDPAQVQMRTLLTRCGRELASAFQWQRLVKNHQFNTGNPSAVDGIYPLPSDFGYMINQTGWTPTTGGMGLPLGGPLSEQIWAMIVASGLGQGTIYASFKVADGVMQFITPVPTDQEVSFAYVAQDWVEVNGNPLTTATRVENNDDVILFDPTMISYMLEARFKQAKGFDASSAQDLFASRYKFMTGIDTPSPVLSMAYTPKFPYLTIVNAPQTGYGI